MLSEKSSAYSRWGKQNMPSVVLRPSRCVASSMTPDLSMWVWFLISSQGFLNYDVRWVRIQTIKSFLILRDLALSHEDPRFLIVFIKHFAYQVTWKVTIKSLGWADTVVEQSGSVVQPGCKILNPGTATFSLRMGSGLSGMLIWTHQYVPNASPVPTTLLIIWDDFYRGFRIDMANTQWE